MSLALIILGSNYNKTGQAVKSVKPSLVVCDLRVRETCSHPSTFSSRERSRTPDKFLGDGRRICAPTDLEPRQIQILVCERLWSNVRSLPWGRHRRTYVFLRVSNGCVHTHPVDASNTFGCPMTSSRVQIKPMELPEIALKYYAEPLEEVSTNAVSGAV